MLIIAQQIIFLQVNFTTKLGIYDLEVTGSQLSVLMSWNDPKTTSFSFQELQNLAGIPEIELRHVLMVILSKILL